RAVMPARTQRLEQSVTRELRHEITREPADRPEGRGARRGRTRAALVIVAVANDADAVAHLERVMHEPFERSPTRVHLDGAFDAAVVGVFHVGVAPAHVGDDAAVLAL